MKIKKASVKIIFIFAVMGIVATSFMTSSCAEEVLKPRPKIGLVLGGGGARGASYIGILKVLEKNRIPVDFIVGSSMGAVIGGGYATGMTPEEIEKQLAGTDWSYLFSDKPIREQMTFRHKEEQKELLDTELGIKGYKILTPKGLVGNQKLDFLLESMCLPVIKVDDFNDFPIRFRAVATDIETGEAVILGKGSLSLAIRASMSIPGVFSPTEIDGRLLVDGGFTKTLPIDIAKSLGADIIIAVYVPEPLSKRDKLNSIISVSAQLLNVMTQQMVKNQTELLGEQDILIVPDLGNMTTADFWNSKKAIEAGEKAAAGITDKLKKYSMTEDEYNAYLAGHRRQKGDVTNIDFIKVEPPSRVSPKAVKARIKTAANAPLDFQTLQDDLTRIYGMGQFENVTFKIRNEDDKTGLFIYTKDKSWGPNYLRFGLNLDNDFAGESYFNALGDYTMTDLGQLGAEWRNRFQIGRTSMYHTDFYQPLNYKDTFFIDPEFKFQRDISDIYTDRVRTAQYQVDSTEGGVSAGVNIGTYARGMMGVVSGHYTAGPAQGYSGLPTFDVLQTAVKASLSYDQLDNVCFPHKGALAETRLFIAPQSWGAVKSYSKLELSALKPFTSDRNTLITSLDIGTNIGTEIPYYDEYMMGGFLNLSGYKMQQLRGQNKGLGRCIYYCKLAKGVPPLLNGVYLGGSLESGYVWQDIHEVDLNKLVLTGSLFIGLDTIMGPVYFAYGLAKDNGSGEFYVHVGKLF